MNKGTMVLVGCVVGAGVLFYTSSGSDAARPSTPATATREAETEVARSGKTPPPRTPAIPAASPTQARLTLAQVRSLPRPFVPPGFAGGAPPVSDPAPTEPPSGSPAPAATPTPTAASQPPTEEPPPTVPSTPAAILTVPVDWWSLPTPPPLPPIPDGSLSPMPPSE